MVKSIHEELYNMQRTLWRRNKEIIDHSILVKEPDFARYEARYRRKVASYQDVSSQGEMLKAVLSANIVYVGDYHTCNQSQRSFLRILKSVIKKTKNFAICLELIHSSHQKMLDRFMAGQIKEETFLKKIGFEQQWIFDLWENFKPIFDFAKYHKIKVIGIDAAPIDSSLKERDEASGEVLAEIYNENPKQKLFVSIGDLHLAPRHLPFEVKRVLKNGRLLRSTRNDIKTLALFQNSEAIYWQLAKKGIEDHVSVVKIDDNSFCRMHTPPMISQQSYINWLEHEEGEIDFADAKHSFLELVDRITKFLNIKLGKEKDNVEIFTAGDLSFMKKLKKKKTFSKKDYEILKRQILSSESYYLATEKIVYLASLSYNHAAEEAAHFIKSICSGPEFPRDLVDAFYANILHEALGFFGSKLINHKRKCLDEKGYRNLLAYFQTVIVPTDRQLEYEAAHLVCEYLKYEKKGRPLDYTSIFEHGPDLFMAITHAIGYMLGDKLYYAMKAGKIRRVTLRKLFYDPWEEDGNPFEVYSSLRKKVASVKIPKRM